jgi:ADP-ribose pyrophosphatase YjhB (NUDIX family)
MSISCPQCGPRGNNCRNPLPAADVIIRLDDGQILLIDRLNPPLGWALPGGFVETGESVPQAACREAQEETGLAVHLEGLLGVYSDPERDPRQHTLSVVYVASAPGQTPRAGSDAKSWRGFALSALPDNLCFDHALILKHYGQYLAGQRFLAAI